MYIFFMFQFFKMNLFNATAAAMMELADSASIDDVDVAEAAAIMVSPAPPVVGFHDLITANISKREILEKGVMAFLDDWRYQVRKDYSGRVATSRLCMRFLHWFVFS